MNWNLVGSIYGRFTIKIAHFIPIRLNKHDRHKQFFFPGWSISKKTSSLKPLSQMIPNCICGILYFRLIGIDSINMLSWLFIVIAHWKNIPLEHIIPIPSQSIFALTVLLNAACLVDKQQVQIKSFNLIRDGAHDLPTLQVSMLTITPQMQSSG